jgi:hypothetical protein
LHSLVEFCSDNSYIRVGTLHSELANLKALDICYFEYNCLSGTIPTELGTLSLLEYLSFGHNAYIHGTIPTELGNVSTLHGLYLYENYMTGYLPSELGNCGEMEQIWIEDNHFQGPIPDSFRNLSMLQELLLGDNYITGTFNNAFCFSTHDWETLSMNNNLLHGTLPSCLAEFNSKMTSLIVNNNYFSGPLPVEYKGFTLLQQVDVSVNIMSGPVPSFLFQLTGLTELLMFDNAFSGPLPSEFGKLTQLFCVDISSTYISSGIPSSLSEWTYLRMLDLSYTLLTGVIPSEVMQLPLLEILYLNSNYLSGTVGRTDLDVQVMEYLSLESNYLSGSLPVPLIHSLKMRNIDISNNYLLGLNPLQLRVGPVLSYLTCSYNLFSGTMPSNWSATNYSVLQYILAEFNEISGSLPIDLVVPMSTKEYYVHSFVQLSLTGNRLVGPVPSAISYHTALTVLALSNNCLSSSLPTSLTLLSSLANLNMSSNQLTGKLSNVFGDEEDDDTILFPNMTYIILSLNSFTGKVPPSMFMSTALQVVSLNSNCFSSSLPSTMCYSSQLQSIAMNSLTTADSCRYKLPKPLSSIFTAVFPRKKLQGSIPSCLWSLPLLETLQFSGNELTGSLSEDLTLSPSLTNVQLGYNVLTGSIPLAIQTHGRFSYLSLQNNKFSGTLNPNFTVNQFNITTNAPSLSLNLEVNRLSGDIPTSFVTLQNIDVLADNLFQCTSYEALPPNDPSSKSYSCGSSGLNTSLYVWVSVACLIVLCCIGLALTMKYISSYSSANMRARIVAIAAGNFAVSTAVSLQMTTMNHASNMNNDNSNGASRVNSVNNGNSVDRSAEKKYTFGEYGQAVVFSVFANSFHWYSFLNPSDLEYLNSVFRFLHMLRFVRISVFRLEVIFIVVVMPTYIILKTVVGSQFSTHTRQYGWITTAAFFHGLAPTVFILLILYGSLLSAVLIFRMQAKFQPVKPSATIISDDVQDDPAGATDDEIGMTKDQLRAIDVITLSSSASSSAHATINPLSALQNSRVDSNDSNANNIVNSNGRSNYLDVDTAVLLRFPTPQLQSAAGHNSARLVGSNPQTHPQASQLSSLHSSFRYHPNHLQQPHNSGAVDSCSSNLDEINVNDPQQQQAGGETSHRMYSISIFSETDLFSVPDSIPESTTSRICNWMYSCVQSCQGCVDSIVLALYEWKYGIVVYPLLMQVINLVATLLGNVVYVTLLQSKRITHNEVLVLPLLISIFKAAWAQLFVGYAIRTMGCLSTRIRIYHQVVMFIVVLIISPVLSTMYADQSCFYRAFVSAPPVVSTYTDNEIVQSCSQTLLYKITQDGFIHSTIVSYCTFLTYLQDISSSSTPPYIYSYQCGSAIMTNFIPVLLYSYIFSLVLPTVRFFVLHTPLSALKRVLPSAMFSAIIANSLLGSDISPIIPVPAAQTAQQHQLPHHISASASKLKLGGGVGHSSSRLSRNGVAVGPFDGATVVSRRFLDVAVMLTFGLACPLLGLTVMFNVAVNTVVWRMMLGKYMALHRLSVVDKASSLSASAPKDNSPSTAIAPTLVTGNWQSMRALQSLERAADGVLDGFTGGLWIILCTICLFWSIIVFDMVADVYGKGNGFIVVAVTIFVFPISLYIISKIVLRFGHGSNSTNNKTGDDDGVDSGLSQRITGDIPLESRRLAQNSVDALANPFGIPSVSYADDTGSDMRSSVTSHSSEFL